MSLHHLFLHGQVLSEASDRVISLSFDEDDLRHVRALRLRPGEHIAVVDASSDYFECEVVSVKRDDIAVRISSKLDSPPQPAKITLVQGLAKGDKVDTVVRAATELGIASVIVTGFERSVVRLDERKSEARVSRWQSVARAAALQSGCSASPLVSYTPSIRALTENLASFDCIVVFWEEASMEQTMQSALLPAFESIHEGNTPSVAVIVGPEGGIAPNEVEMVLLFPQARIATLGHHILRTETAGIVASALVSSELGCL